jgi:hypothetical protein
MVVDMVALHAAEIAHFGIHEMKPAQKMRQRGGAIRKAQTHM